MRRHLWRRREGDDWNSLFDLQTSGKPRKKRRFVNGQRLRAVKMVAWSVFGRATGMENGGSILGWQTRQFQVLECGRGDGRYFLPILQLEISYLSISEAKPSVWLVQFTLKFEQCRCELTEKILGPEGLAGQGGTDEVPEMTCEFRKFGD